MRTRRSGSSSARTSSALDLRHAERREIRRRRGAPASPPASEGLELAIEEAEVPVEVGDRPGFVAAEVEGQPEEHTAEHEVVERPEHPAQREYRSGVLEGFEKASTERCLSPPDVGAQAARRVPAGRA